MSSQVTASPMSNGVAPGGLPGSSAATDGLVVVAFTDSGKPITLDIPKTLSDEITRITPGAPLPTEGGTVVSIASDGSLFVTQAAASDDGGVSSSPEDIVVTISESNKQVTLDIPRTFSDEISLITPGAPIPTAGGKVMGIASDGSLIVSTMPAAGDSNSLSRGSAGQDAGSAYLIIGSSSIAINPTEEVTKTVGTQLVTAEDGKLLFSGSTFTAGASDLTIDGQAVTLHSVLSTATLSTSEPLATSTDPFSGTTASIMGTSSPEDTSQVDGGMPSSTAKASASASTTANSAHRASIGSWPWALLCVYIGVLGIL